MEMADLLIVACSERKRHLPQVPIAAIQRYDGVFFRVLRKWLRTNVTKSLDVLIISARFGLIRGDTAIPEYDHRMTPTRACELAQQVRKSLRGFIARGNYQRTFVNLGRCYQPTIAGLDGLEKAFWAKGAIGQRARQMKEWLEASKDVSNF